VKDNTQNKFEKETPNENQSIPLERMEEEPIAIIGMACRLPASNDIEEFWNLLINKGDAIKKLPEWRWLDEQVKTTGDKETTKDCRKIQAGWLKCPVDEFDAKFFGMSPKELEFTDPQQRMLLEVSWEALEDAAIDPTSLHGSQTGIFTGTWKSDYVDLMNKLSFEESEFFRSYIGNSYGATAGRTATTMMYIYLHTIFDVNVLMRYFRNGPLLRSDWIEHSDRIWLLIFNGCSGNGMQ